MKKSSSTPTFAVTSFKFACAVIFHTMPQDQVLSAGWCANRISLDELHPMQGALQSGRRKKALRDNHPPQVVDCDRHDEILSNSVRVADGLPRNGCPKHREVRTKPGAAKV